MTCSTLNDTTHTGKWEIGNRKLCDNKFRPYAAAAQNVSSGRRAERNESHKESLSNVKCETCHSANIIKMHCDVCVCVCSSPTTFVGCVFSLEAFGHFIVWLCHSSSAKWNFRWEMCADGIVCIKSIRNITQPSSSPRRCLSLQSFTHCQTGSFECQSYSQRDSAEQWRHMDLFWKLKHFIHSIHSNSVHCICGFHTKLQSNTQLDALH